MNNKIVLFLVLLICLLIVFIQQQGGVVPSQEQQAKRILFTTWKQGHGGYGWHKHYYHDSGQYWFHADELFNCAILIDDESEAVLHRHKTSFEIIVNHASLYKAVTPMNTLYIVRSNNTVSEHQLPEKWVSKMIQKIRDNKNEAKYQDFLKMASQSINLSDVNNTEKTKKE